MRSRPADRPAVFRIGRGGRLLLAALAWSGLAIQAAMAGALPAGYESLPSVDWYYASSFGTGKYRAGERSVTVLVGERGADDRLARLARERLEACRVRDEGDG